MLLHMYQIFSSLRAHLHFSVHFSFTFMVNSFFSTPYQKKRKKEEKEKKKKKVVISFLTQFVCFENTFHVFMEKQVCFSIEIIHENFPRSFSF